MKNSSRLKAQYRASMRRKGFVLKQFWVRPENWPRILRYMRRER